MRREETLEVGDTPIGESGEVLTLGVGEAFRIEVDDGPLAFAAHHGAPPAPTVRQLERSTEELRREHGCQEAQRSRRSWDLPPGSQYSHRGPERLMPSALVPAAGSRTLNRFGLRGLSPCRRREMTDGIGLLLVLALWWALQVYVLPRLGVPT